MGKDEEEKEMSFFFSSSFDAANTATATDVAPADAAKAPVKDGSEEEAVDGTAWANRFFETQRTEDLEKMDLLLIIKITLQMSITVMNK